MGSWSLSSRLSLTPHHAPLTAECMVTCCCLGRSIRDALQGCHPVPVEAPSSERLTPEMVIVSIVIANSGLQDSFHVAQPKSWIKRCKSRVRVDKEAWWCKAMPAIGDQRERERDIYIYIYICMRSVSCTEDDCTKETPHHVNVPAVSLIFWDLPANKERGLGPDKDKEIRTPLEYTFSEQMFDMGVPCGSLPSERWCRLSFLV